MLEAGVGSANQIAILFLKYYLYLLNLDKMLEAGVGSANELYCFNKI